MYCLILFILRCKQVWLPSGQGWYLVPKPIRGQGWRCQEQGVNPLINDGRLGFGQLGGIFEVSSLDAPTQQLR